MLCLSEVMESRVYSQVKLPVNCIHFLCTASYSKINTFLGNKYFFRCVFHRFALLDLKFDFEFKFQTGRSSYPITTIIR